jgi:hypothetical protein
MLCSSARRWIGFFGTVTITPIGCAAVIAGTVVVAVFRLPVN